MPRPPVQVRWMIRRDMPEVLEIERRAFEYPWTEEQFLQCLRQRNCIGMVAEDTDSNSIVGFMLYELLKNELHLLNFAVRDSCRRCGVGTEMIYKLTKKLSQQRRTVITLEVNEASLPAQLFFKRMGFRATSVLRDYYELSEDVYLSAYRMQFDLFQSECGERPFSVSVQRNIGKFFA